MLKRTDAITNEVLELMKSVVAYPTVVTMDGTQALCDRVRWDVLFRITAKRFYFEGPSTCEYFTNKKCNVMKYATFCRGIN